MPKRLQNITLDIENRDISTQFMIKQFEDLELNITVVKDRQVIDLTDCTAIFSCEKISNNSCIITDNKILVTIDYAELTQTGFYKCEIAIIDSSGILKTPTFYFFVRKSQSGEVIIQVHSLLDADGYYIKDTEGNLLKVRR